jgi:hypothetical protein
MHQVMGQCHVEVGGEGGKNKLSSHFGGEFMLRGGDFSTNFTVNVFEIYATGNSTHIPT